MGRFTNGKPSQMLGKQQGFLVSSKLFHQPMIHDRLLRPSQNAFGYHLLVQCRRMLSAGRPSRHEEIHAGGAGRNESGGALHATFGFDIHDGQACW